MAEDKKPTTPANATKAEGATVTEKATETNQATASKKEDAGLTEVREYTLRAGNTHTAVVQGEIVEYSGDNPDNNVVRLTGAQYKNFKDKFEEPK